jgi:hypothetical protein
VAAFAAIGTFLFVSQSLSSWKIAAKCMKKGFDSGILTTTIAHQSWKDYFNHPTTAQTGAVRKCPSIKKRQKIMAGKDRWWLPT